MSSAFVMPPSDERTWLIADARIAGEVRTIEAVPAGECIDSPTETLETRAEPGTDSVFEALATAYLFDSDVTREGSLRRAETAFRGLLGQVAPSDAAARRIRVKLAATRIAQSLIEGEHVLDEALTLLEPELNADMDASVECFGVLMGTGAVWQRAAQRFGDDFFLKQALTYLTFAEVYCQSAAFSILQSLDDDWIHGKVHQLVLEAMMAQREVELLLLGSDILDEEPAPEGDRVGTLLFLRPLQSSRRFPLANQFKPSSHLVSLRREPPSISLEASLHRTLLFRFGTMRIGGPADLLGMTNGSFVLTPGQTARASAAARWRQIVEACAKTSKIVLILFWDSAGVLWEVDTLLSGQPQKCVLLMLPALVSHDAGLAWESGRKRLASKHYEVPEYRPEGGFYLYGSEGKAIRVLEFSTIWSVSLADSLAAHVLA